MFGGVQAATRGNQNRVEAQASESAVIICARHKPVEGGFPGYPDLPQIARDEASPAKSPRPAYSLRAIQF